MRDIINGIFLLFSLVLANYTDTTLGKRINNLINKNYYIKLLIIYILIYFTINFTSSDGVHIKEHIKNTSILFMLYIMISKINISVVLVVFLLILINYTINSHILYLDKNDKKQEIKKYEKYSDYFTLIIIIIVIIAFIYKILNKSQRLKYIFSNN